MIFCSIETDCKYSIPFQLWYLVPSLIPNIQFSLCAFWFLCLYVCIICWPEIDCRRTWHSSPPLGSRLFLHHKTWCRGPGVFAWGQVSWRDSARLGVSSPSSSRDIIDIQMIMDQSSPSLPTPRDWRCSLSHVSNSWCSVVYKTFISQ